MNYLKELFTCIAISFFLQELSVAFGFIFASFIYFSFLSLVICQSNLVRCSQGFECVDMKGTFKRYKELNNFVPYLVF